MKINILKKTPFLFLTLVKLFLILLSFIVGIQIFIKTFEYYQPDFSYGFLKGKEELFQSFYKYAFYVHIVSAPVILLSGLTQFFRFIRIKLLAVHKLLGLIYVFFILFLAAPGGLVMGFYAHGGFWAIISFMLLTPLWWFFTWKAYKYIKSGNYEKHATYMTRSMILTLSAVFLRIYAFIALWFFQDNSPETYILISWLSWLPNLLLFELWFYLKPKSSAFLS